VLERFVTYVLLVMSSIPVTFGESDLRLLEQPEINLEWISRFENPSSMP
jgi:hypothetical protein